MGAWDYGSFDNDAALDWISSFLQEPSKQLIKETLEAATGSGDEYLEAPDSSMAIAAAEVVAALKGAPHPNIPEDLRTYVKKSRMKIQQPMINLALAATERIRTDSELKELWEENEVKSPKWFAAVVELETRLKSAV